MTETRSPATAGSILYDASRLDKPDDRLFAPEYWAGRGALVQLTGGRGAVLFIRDGQRRWVLRHYRRGGLVARVVNDAYLWLGAGRTRSFREWRLLSRLHGEGFPVPAPVAARFVRAGWIYRADLLTEEVPGARTLADCITGAAVSGDVWRSVGSLLARLHRRGVHHVDLNAHNLLLDESALIHVIDFDRARIRGRGAWEQRVLARLQRSLEKIRRQRADVRFGEGEWAELLAGYAERGQGTGDRGQ